MSKYFLPVVLMFASASLFAQTHAAEPVVEKANMLTVLIFVAVFVASCGGYVVYLIWTRRKAAAAEVVVAPPPV